MNLRQLEYGARAPSRAAREVHAVRGGILRARLSEGWWRPAISEDVSVPVPTGPRA